MTATTTQREFISEIDDRVPEVDSPAVPARARARVPITVRYRNKARAWVSGRRWPVIDAQPPTLRQLGKTSAVDPSRIPADHLPLRILWTLSNLTDRLLMFLLAAVAPTFLTGAIRWCAARPTRRIGLYLAVAALTAAYLIGAH